MRYIDIYKKVGNDFVLVAQNCIQIENADLTKKAVLKSFQMADGSTTTYTSGNDSAEMALNLECSAVQAEAISEALHVGELYFTGMRAGAKPLPTPTDNGYFPTYLSEDVPAFIGCLTENSSVQILEKASHADLFALQIPLKLATSGGQLRTQLIPTAGLLETGGISLIKTDGESDIDTEFRYSDYRYYQGISIRKSVIFSEKPTLKVGIWHMKEDCSYILTQNGGLRGWDDSHGDLRAECGLVPGLNEFILEISETNLKSVIFKFYVYRQAVQS